MVSKQEINFKDLRYKTTFDALVISMNTVDEGNVKLPINLNGASILMAWRKKDFNGKIAKEFSKILR